ncbi:hypothetical protein NP233_g5456 [Leucocoprinus birnbaumii]|uniref:EVE domain-containing protein n=1 Tax=Leucocoprinus birnbaumii TaxID=56174 RepID=A0AAD5VSU1_9AGAR|nr:hypothetical protein NP233_g5456 [Leucocoprinus birnbaumii]
MFLTRRQFSVDDFESVKTSPWEGVRNYEARNLMKEMQVGEKVAVFYHSNCKNPGIAAFAEVAKMSYPDYTAWDASHPYYDPKSDKDNPRWHMVDLSFTARAEHFIPLTLLRYIADTTVADDLPAEIKYIGEDGVKAIKSMDLVTRGRLSVQRVEANAWDTIQLLAKNGGWDGLNLKPAKKSKKTTAAKISSKAATKIKKKRQPAATAEEDDGGDSPLSSLESSGDEKHIGDSVAKTSKPRSTAPRKRKAPPENDTALNDPPRRSRRHKSD